jgi:deazaflavin-dependent oxidoreductase (nitroreductase family)
MPITAWVIPVLTVLAVPILLIRFRKRRVAAFNLAVTNRITGLFADWLPGFGILTHVGRKSGKVYRTPVNVFRASNGFIIALTYSSQSEWVKNVLAAGGCELKTRWKKYHLSAPKIVHDPTRRRFPIPVRIVLRIVGADEYMDLTTHKDRQIANTFENIRLDRVFISLLRICIRTVSREGTDRSR